MKKKLTSRKFWLAAVPIVAGIIGLVTGNDGLTSQLTSAGLIIVPAIFYILTEGKIDAASVASIADAVSDTVTAFKNASTDRSDDVDAETDAEATTTSTEE